MSSENQRLATISFRIACCLGLGWASYGLCGLFALGQEVALAIFVLLFAVTELVWHAPRGAVRASLYAICLGGLLAAGLYLVYCAQLHVLQARP